MGSLTKEMMVEELRSPMGRGSTCCLVVCWREGFIEKVVIVVVGL